jgi:hypothetical protein
VVGRHFSAFRLLLKQHEDPLLFGCSEELWESHTICATKSDWPILSYTIFRLIWGTHKNEKIIWMRMVCPFTLFVIKFENKNSVCCKSSI